MVGDITIGLAELGEPAIASLRLHPTHRTPKEFGAVILAASDRNVSIGRVKADAVELDSFKIPVEIGPHGVGEAAVGIQSINAAVIAVEQFAVGIERHGVMIGMR